MAKEYTLLFVGSKERLKRSVTKQGGSILEDCRFSLVWRSSYFRWGLAFRINGNYEKRETGYLLRYRFLPTIATVLWVSVPFVLCMGFGINFFLEGNVDGALSIFLFSMLYPSVALWQAKSCHTQFRKVFEIETR